MIRMDEDLVKLDMKIVFSKLLDSEEDIENATKMAYELYTRGLRIGGRRPSSLKGDCIYIIMNASGYPTSIPFLTYIIQEAWKTPTKRTPMKGYSSKTKRWFLTEKGKSAIIDVIGDEEIYGSVMKVFKR
tara:strand:- start:28166 stop:28555 length:390 start_codon:yes stop_codon:yes gene_type:complete